MLVKRGAFRGEIGSVRHRDILRRFAGWREWVATNHVGADASSAQSSAASTGFAAGKIAELRWADEGVRPYVAPCLCRILSRCMSASSTHRLAYIDWMRGLACVLMFQTHCYDSWLSPEARKSTFFMWSQLGGTLPAPLFLFLAGISFALVTDKLRQKGSTPNAIALTTIRRGAEILGLGLLFRLQEYVIAWGWAPWSDLLRVDILNTIGVSMMLMGVDVLDRAEGEFNGSYQADSGPDRNFSSDADFAADSAALDYVASALVALADRILHRRRA